MESGHAQTNKDIDVLRDIIIDLVDPDKIILFGSYAYGTADENSDADFLVIKNGVEHTVRDEAKLATSIHYLRKERGVCTRCDAFLENEQSAQSISENGGAYADAFSKGTVIYVR
jgi:DNA polymerase sigma